jgi:hypothetical protein
MTAPNFAAGGFSLQGLWVYTDNTSNLGLPRWVEVGVTQGWQGQNLYTFYTARGDLRVAPPIYDEYRFSTISPIVGQNKTYRLYSNSSGSYIADISGTMFVWGSHQPDSKFIEIGIEATCDNGRVDNYRITGVQLRRKSDKAWIAINNGALYRDAPVVTEWCAQPTSARTALNSQLPLAC